MQDLRAFLSRVVRFAIVGVAGTLLYATLAFGLEYGGVPVFWAHIVASAISLAASYLGQKIFTFQIRGQHRQMGTRFLIATALLVATQSALVYVLDRAGVEARLVLMASTLYYPPASFLLHTFWTFQVRRALQN